MRNLLNPKWIFLINTLPIIVLGLLFIGEFNIIKSLLEEESIILWKLFGATLGVLGLINLAYALYLSFKKQNVSVFYGALAQVSYIPFIYLYGYYSNIIIPFSIPQWMISGNMLIYVGTFLMPTLAYSLLVLVAHFTKETERLQVWKNFLIAISVPIVWYLYVQIIVPLWQPVGNNFEMHTFLILIIIGALVFLFFLVRVMFILIAKKAKVWQTYEMIWKIPIAIIFPLLGLAINNGLFQDSLPMSSSGVFGNFNSLWFYVLALLNGIFICIPVNVGKPYRLLLFIGRNITFTYTLYFFLVFLLFLPISAFAIFAFGVGFLILTPLVLFIIHLNELSKDFIFLRKHYSKNVLRIISFCSFLVVPTFITTSFLNKKNTLNNALDFLYHPDYSKAYNIDKNALQKTMDIVANHKSGRRNSTTQKQTPYLTAYFNWLVLDNLTLSGSKINHINKVFFGSESTLFNPENIRNNNVEITNILTNSTFDKSQNAWISWVNLEITNCNENNWVSEYTTTIDLPIGCWISDYYLYVGDRKEKGILSEKKSAMWIFSQIQNENRDPGILYYLTGNKVAFRVFPFAKDEIRKTGIEFIHREPIQLTLDGNIVSLGNTEELRNSNFENENIIYISAKEKEKLKQVQRKPYFHFLLDASKEGSSAKLIKQIERLTTEYSQFSENAEVSFVNSYVTTHAVKSAWKQTYQKQKFEGGYYLDRAIKKTLVNAYQRKDKSYPIIVVVTDSIENAVLKEDFSDYKMTFPESNLFYHLKEDAKLYPHSLISNPKTELPFTTQNDLLKTTLAYKYGNNSVAFLADNEQPDIILKRDIFKLNEAEIKKNNWETILLLQGKWMTHILHPDFANIEWVDLVKYSFISQAMIPLTSYLVVENEAQKAMLKKKQKQVLKGNKSLDIGEDAQRMSEPGLLVLMLITGFILWFRNRKLKKTSATIER